MTRFPNGIYGGISHLSTPEVLARRAGESQSVVGGRALCRKLQVILQLGGCLHWGYGSV